ncbi:hypothetical protein JQ600_02515 [Bradyrhizobium sp. AUGA SZCCT0176]|uniref:hypothetical protein n=1 Tax=Bradyrhizobium sp. AUGA SZCCT0176 TaxID=2807664 RepID=UPI001BAE190E|nr:hypothetical protein [Bradyrhizobium sp. AUGA SZCCT0176]MBR1223771.1 hypothetical protein [Bradyrhizobium sp. AUGA SZCCT0176]
MIEETSDESYMMKYSIDEITLIEVDALIAMAKAKITGGSRMARIVRTVTEALSFGKYCENGKPEKYCDSTKAKSINRRMSRAAADLMGRSSRREFETGTILEHQMTIKQLREQLSSRIGLDRESAIEILSSHPLVTITTAENEMLTKNKHHTKGEPNLRYSGAQIEIVEVEKIVFAGKTSVKAKKRNVIVAPGPAR